MKPEQFAEEIWDRLQDMAIAYSAFAKKMGVDENEMYVVDALWDQGEGLSQRSICEKCDLGKQTVSAVCRRLVASGGVVAKPGTVDKRERIMTLTEQGRAAWRRPIERMRDLELQAAYAISPEDADAFFRVVAEYEKALQSEVRR